MKVLNCGDESVSSPRINAGGAMPPSTNTTAGRPTSDTVRHSSCCVRGSHFISGCVGALVRREVYSSGRIDFQTCSLTTRNRIGHVAEYRETGRPADSTVPQRRDEEAGAPESTVELLARARAGDEAALNEVFARAIPLVKRWASGRLPRWARDMIDTDDLVQETVVKR
jgi:hypothetical protein